MRSELGVGGEGFWGLGDLVTQDHPNRQDWRYCPSSLGIIGLVEGRLGACCVVRRYEPLSWVFIGIALIAV